MTSNSFKNLWYLLTHLLWGVRPITLKKCMINKAVLFKQIFSPSLVLEYSAVTPSFYDAARIQCRD